MQPWATRPACTWAALVAQVMGEEIPTEQVAARVAARLALDPHGPELTRLAWLGLFTARPVGLAEATACAAAGTFAGR
ncbi:MAG: hypothetical protein WKG07_14895 [Hymenobacter sp.]